MDPQEAASCTPVAPFPWGPGSLDMSVFLFSEQVVFSCRCCWCFLVMYPTGTRLQGAGQQGTSPGYGVQLTYAPWQGPSVSTSTSVP